MLPKDKLGNQPLPWVPEDFRATGIVEKVDTALALLCVRYYTDNTMAVYIEKSYWSKLQMGKVCYGTDLAELKQQAEKWFYGILRQDFLDPYFCPAPKGRYLGEPRFGKGKRKVLDALANGSFIEERSDSPYLFLQPGVGGISIIRWDLLNDFKARGWLSESIVAGGKHYTLTEEGRNAATAERSVAHA